MKSPPYSAILAALRLTRAGDLVQAAGLLQRTLRGAGSPPAANVRRVVSSGTATASQSVDSADAVACIATAVPRSQATDVQRSPYEKPTGQFISLSFSSPVGTRAYKLFIPSNYRGQPTPLIVMLHGCTQSADDFAAGTRMNALAQESTWLVAYPEQSTSANSSKCWNWFNPHDQQRDRGEPALVVGITRQIMNDYAVEPKRVYIAGMSAGAAAAAVLAAAYPDVYAALGVHSGLACGIARDVLSAFAAMKSGRHFSGTGSLERSPTRNRNPMPTIVFHGDRDATVHPRNSDRFAEDMETANYEQQIEMGQVRGGRAYTQTIYTDARGQRMFEQWVIHGAGHAWSGGSAAGSYTDPQGPDASREILRFFTTHQHPD